MKINQLDLFSGIGGFHLGFEKAGYKVNSFFSEIDKHSIAVYKNKFKNSKYVGSVTDVRGSDLPKIDLLSFGSPCQDFSVANASRAGMGGQRSSLILEAIRLIGECRPRVFIWENVKGTFSSNSGEDFAAILQSFANIGGYRLEWQLLNTSWFPRTPQNRERIYLVGYSTKTKRSWRGVFPIGAEGEYAKKSQPTQGDKAVITNDNGQIEVADYRNDEGLRIRSNGDSPTLSARRHSEKDISTMPPLIINPKIVSYTRDAKGKVTNRNLKDQANTIHSSVGGGGNTDQFVQPNYSSKALNETIMNNDLKKGKVQALDLYNRSARDESPTLTEPHHNTLRMFDGARIRRLTPIECERLQGFPDNHTEYGDYDGEIVKVSNTQRYKQCGNAVTVDVVQAVAEKCKPLFK